MGRLIRKRDPGRKKKKQDGEVSAITNNASAAEVKKLPGSSDEIQKKQPVIQKKPPSPTKSSSGTQEQNFIGKSLQFLREVKAELKKVTWPSRKQTMGSTVVVILLVMIISLFLGLVDAGLSNVIRMVLQ